jgi:hypothetical protein
MSSNIPVDDVRRKQEGGYHIYEEEKERKKQKSI